jgi:predicted tellurium resistance membrane protein TerC
VAGSAILMALLERFRVLIWAGGALLGWVAGDIMATDPGLIGVLSSDVLHSLHIWAGRIGGAIVIAAGYLVVRRHRTLMLDELLAGCGLLIWIVVDIFVEARFGGTVPNVTAIWMTRGILLILLVLGYAGVRQAAKKPS